jgi:hypothetical protein
MANKFQWPKFKIQNLYMILKKKHFNYVLVIEYSKLRFIYLGLGIVFWNLNNWYLLFSYNEVDVSIKCVPDPVLVLILVNGKFIGDEDENDDEGGSSKS